MSLKLSDAQFVALLWIVDQGEGRIVRFPGGFWTTTKLVEQARERRDQVPDWHTGTNTVRALEKAGFVERAFCYPNEWQDDRKVTNHGRAALVAAKEAGQRAKAEAKWNLADDLKTFDIAQKQAAAR